MNAALTENLDSLGYVAMTPIQSQSLPLILDGNDVIAQAKTGSGKTAAFGLGLLNSLDVKKFRVQSLVLCPTRELADQVAKEIRKLARAIHNIKILTLCGGMPFGPQIGSLEHGAHIIVGTPGRVEEHIRKHNLNLDHLELFVLDEADRMLDMGFQPSVDAVVDAMPKKRQTLLFSATYPKQIESISQRIMLSPKMVIIEGSHSTATIKQIFYKVADNKQRLTALRLVLKKYRPDSAVVFCNTKRETQEIAEELRADGFFALALNGDMEQKDRDQTLVMFANKSSSILVATDVAARGLDIDALDAVINFHISRDVDTHVHRIGRTGRAGSKGVAFSFYQDRELYKVEEIAHFLEFKIESEELPSWSLLEKESYKPAMATLQIDGGKKQKVRAGDILGALTGKNGIAGTQVGKIDIFDNWAYVAVKRNAAKPALKKLSEQKIKGRSFRVRRLNK